MIHIFVPMAISHAHLIVSIKALSLNCLLLCSWNSLASIGRSVDLYSMEFRVVVYQYLSESDADQKLHPIAVGSAYQTVEYYYYPVNQHPNMNFSLHTLR